MAAAQVTMRRLARSAFQATVISTGPIVKARDITSSRRTAGGVAARQWVIYDQPGGGPTSLFSSMRR